MEQFLLNLTFGISEIPRNKRDIFEILDTMHTIEKSKKIFKLKDEFVIGHIDVVKNKNLYFLKPLKIKEKDYKIIDKILLYDDDLVLAKIKSSKRDKRPRATIIKILKREKTKCIGILKKIKNNLKICNLKNGEILPIKVSQKSLNALPLHCLFEIDLSNLKILNVIGTLNEAKNDLIIALLMHNKAESFSDEIISFCKSFLLSADLANADSTNLDSVSVDSPNADSTNIDPSYYPNRINLAHLPFISIDPSDAKDFDDALYFDGTYLYVAIADVSYYVPQDCAIDKEALNRGFSIYFPDKVIPMLPKILSNDLCSLKEGQNRLSFIWKLKINKKTLQISQSELFEGIIKVSKNYTYDEFDRILQEANNPLSRLFSITSRIRKNRLKNGLDFANNEIKLELDSNFEIKNIIHKKELDSHHLVEECMLLANKESAKMLEKHCGIYRIHDEIDSKNLKALFGDLSFLDKFGDIKFDKKLSTRDNIFALQNLAKRRGLGERGLSEILDKVIITYLPKAKYSPHNSGHFALGFPSYSHFTSPIRRYSDIIVHRILKFALQNDQKKINYLSKNLESICARLNFLEKDIANLELEFNDRKFARFYQIGEVIDCIITHTKDETRAKILDSGARIFLDRKCQRFSIVRAKITKADIETSRIEGKILV